MLSMPVTFDPRDQAFYLDLKTAESSTRFGKSRNGYAVRQRRLLESLSYQEGSRVLIYVAPLADSQNKRTAAPSLNKRLYACKGEESRIQRVILR